MAKSSLLDCDEITVRQGEPWSKLGSDILDLPADLFLEEAEWKTLCVYSTKNPVPAEHPPTIREASRMIATIGGFQGRKSDGEPGTETLWRGLQRLQDMTGMWRITPFILEIK